MNKDAEDNTDWQAKLTPEQYHVLREKGTEPPFSGALLYNEAAGAYKCAACGREVFDSKTKFDSGSGWPSFSDVLPGAIKLEQDTSFGMVRTEIICATCGSHLGHMFQDFPGSPSGKDYCINSAALNFRPKTTNAKDKENTK